MNMKGLKCLFYWSFVQVEIDPSFLSMIEEEWTITFKGTHPCIDPREILRRHALRAETEFGPMHWAPIWVTTPKGKSSGAHKPSATNLRKYVQFARDGSTPWEQPLRWCWCTRLPQWSRHSREAHYLILGQSGAFSGQFLSIGIAVTSESAQKSDLAGTCEFQ